MIKKKITFFFFLLLILSSCSFDNKTGLWKGLEKEKRRILELERQQNKELVKIYSSEAKTLSEIKATKTVNLNKPKSNNSWPTPDFNKENFTGNLYLSGLNIFLKKKVGKNKFKISKLMSSPVTIDNNIIISDDVGNIYNINKRGKVIWKKNIYKKLYKKIYKNLSITTKNGKIYVSDNVGFVYSISLESGEVIWIKNFGIPFKSKINIFDEKIFLINQDNRIFCLDANDGSKIWDILSIQTFIKAQNFLSISISKDGYLVALVSSGDLIKAKINNGQVFWSFNATASSFAHDTDFFSSSSVVIVDDEIIFSASDSTYSFNYTNGYLNWKQEIKSSHTPVIDKQHVFIVSNDGYFVCLERKSGKIIWATNILSVLKEKKRNTQITGFVMGSGKIYSATYNGYLIISSASKGEVESFEKIGDTITSAPIISDGSLYILTENSRIFGFN